LRFQGMGIIVLPKAQFFTQPKFQIQKASHPCPHAVRKYFPSVKIPKSSL
jgi:hypothetical protein